MLLQQACANLNKIRFCEHGNLHDMKWPKTTKAMKGINKIPFFFMQATSELQARKMSLLPHFAESFPSTHTHMALGG